MDFIKYCLKNRDYNTLKAIRMFSLSEEDNRERRKIVSGALAGTAATGLIGYKMGEDSAEDESKDKALEWLYQNKGKDGEIDYDDLHDAAMNDWDLD